MSNKKESTNYIDNEKMYEVITVYLKAVKESEENDTPRPRIPEYLGECFIKIAEKRATERFYRDYPFKEEMILDAVENCVLYIYNFDYIKYKNPFAYFSQYVYYAFLRRIYREKKQLYGKFKLHHNSAVFQEMAHSDDDSYNANDYLEYDAEYMDDFIAKFEEAEAKQKAKKKERERVRGLEKALESEETNEDSTD